MSKGWSAFLIFMCLVPASLWSAFAASTIWRWFAVPIGAPPLSVVRTMGLAMLVGMYRYAGNSRARKDYQEKSGGELFGEFAIKAALIPALVLLMGRVYLAFL